jgi:hypothetical protein
MLISNLAEFQENELKIFTKYFSEKDAHNNSDDFPKKINYQYLFYTIFHTSEKKSSKKIYYNDIIII